ncbi:predicted protein [Pyrenophora tritici-repentis Pt-1C-BFP]|uniref:Uncharacterized protein n=1 Tax=Pyrenophora tritici-repentis (strain Pt-1C-BFP) TaxID=426418 RepID=B2VWZ7_PYRTR|nr:uncharacterized protein PTRG_00234 [Pyrenophora tritici-repentis Pt-1C-BFP]EDU39672.1 predicted protein [Pyrenophora tritici-repentis Pt-1C-BFP]
MDFAAHRWSFVRSSRSDALIVARRSSVHLPPASLTLSCWKPGCPQLLNSLIHLERRYPSGMIRTSRINRAPRTSVSIVRLQFYRLSVESRLFICIHRFGKVRVIDKHWQLGDDVPKLDHFDLFRVFRAV